MSTRFTLTDSDGNSLAFSFDEATDTGQILEHWSVEMGQDKTASGNAVMQIRPGLRFQKVFEMNLDYTKYNDFLNMLRGNPDDFYISYATVPDLLSDNDDINTTNDFKIVFNMGEVKSVSGGQVFKFDLGISSVELF